MTMRYISLVVSVIFVLFLITSCGEEEEDETPALTTGSVSGIVKFEGEPPEGESEIQVSLFSEVGEKGPVGPPDHYSEPFEKFTGEVQYKISGVSFGTYKLAAVGWESPDSPQDEPEVVLGMHGGMQPKSITVSEAQPDVTGIDITADYARLTVD